MASYFTPRVMTFTTAGVGSISAACAAIYYSLKDYTIKELLVSSGKEIIKDNTQLTAAFNEFKDDVEFTNTISTKNQKIDSKTSLDIGPAALDSWCKITLRRKLSESKELINKAIKYCTKPPLTIAEKIKRNNKKLVNVWDSKLGTLKSSDTQNQLLEDLKKFNSNLSDLNSTTEAKDALEKWCKDTQKTQLIEDKSKATWIKFENRCLEN